MIVIRKKNKKDVILLLHYSTERFYYFESNAFEQVNLSFPPRFTRTLDATRFLLCSARSETENIFRNKRATDSSRPMFNKRHGCILICSGSGESFVRVNYHLSFHLKNFFQIIINIEAENEVFALF